MNVYTFMYETEGGSLGEYECEAPTIIDAKDMARVECPDAVDCCIEVLVDGQ